MCPLAAVTRCPHLQDHRRGTLHNNNNNNNNAFTAHCITFVDWRVCHDVVRFVAITHRGVVRRCGDAHTIKNNAFG